MNHNNNNDDVDGSTFSLLKDECVFCYKVITSLLISAVDDIHSFVRKKHFFYSHLFYCFFKPWSDIFRKVW